MAGSTIRRERVARRMDRCRARMTCRAICPARRLNVYTRLQCIGIAGYVAGQTHCAVGKREALTCVVLTAARL